MSGEVLTADGRARVKEGGLSTNWVLEHDSAMQLALAGDRIGLVRADGEALVKEGGLSATWVTENTGVIDIALSSGVD
ncbi:hypothetical protein [Microbispora sp. H10830]|uniref:hypothetical protein n=1 Tax=Microbispora sp. H10830 TaxID=2729109 RepID=UPI001600B929|nr:hypothetical protein [Microbispora sp. H10830]